jgi:hypothetical protein
MARVDLGQEARARRLGRDIHAVMGQIHGAAAGADQTAQAARAEPPRRVAHIPGRRTRAPIGGDRRDFSDVLQARFDPAVGAQIEAHAGQEDAVEEALEQRG